MIHLVTAVGGRIDVLEQMLQHYRSIGIESFFVNLNLANEQDPAREQVGAITRRFGCGIASVTVGNWMLVQQQQYLRQREQYPSDWFLLADHDEFQVYPAPIQDVIADCGRWDYIRGCMIDRIARDGSFPPLDGERPVWDQFPMGGALTPQILAGDLRKVVAVRGPVVLLPGNHHTIEGRPCPTRDYYIPIHHFKWIAGIEEKLRLRAEEFQHGGFKELDGERAVCRVLSPKRRADRVGRSESADRGVRAGVSALGEA